MSPRQWWTGAVLLALMLAALFEWTATRNSGAPLVSPRLSLATSHAQLVDERPLLTARAMAQLAAGQDERQLADQIVQIADHEVDLAFHDALLEATHFVLQPADKVLLKRVSQLESQVAGDQAHVSSLKQRVGATNGLQQEDLQDELDLAQAQLELDGDQLSDARDEVMRSGADPGGLIQQQFEEHQAAEQARAASATRAASASAAGAGASEQAGFLMWQLAAWRTLGARADQLRPARSDAARTESGLARQRDSLRVRVADARARLYPGAAASAPPGADSLAPSARPAMASKEAAVALRWLADDQKLAADLDRRIQDERSLRSGYDSWIALIRTHQRAVAHGMFRSALWIFLVVFAVFIFGLAIDRYIGGPASARTRLRTLRGVIRSTAQVVGALLILLVLFGPPSQLGTLLGLAGAGLTIALKDFVLAFFGWFVLMGKHGMRVGDWVEINGVDGEVVEINLLRTILLETGGGMDTGHPTGRQVAFMNGYAIEGHYFNFTTNGQWMWDELRVNVPPQQDPYPILADVQATLAKEMEGTAHQAEEEWRSATAGYKVRAVSPMPDVTMHMTSSGVEVRVRYMARAPERPAIRARLSEALVHLLHRRPAGGASERPADR